MELPAQGDGELLVHDLHDLLGGRDALHDLFGQRPRPHALEEVVGHLDGHVGLQQGGPDVGQGVVHLLGMELSPAAEFLENAVESVAQGVEHTNGVSPWPRRRPSVSSGRGTRRNEEANDRRTRCAWSASSRTCDGSSPPSARSRWDSRSATGATTRVRAPARGCARPRPHDRQPRDRELGPPGARSGAAAFDRDRGVRARRRRACRVGVDRAERPRRPGVGDRVSGPARGRGTVGTARRAARRGRVPRGAALPEAARAQTRGPHRSSSGPGWPS